MLLLDVDIKPSSNLRQDFFNLLKQEAFAYDTVLVVPVFEVEKGVRIRTKSDLVQAYHNQLARPFHTRTCPACHKPTKYEAYISEYLTEECSNISNVLAIFRQIIDLPLP